MRTLPLLLLLAPLAACSRFPKGFGDDPKDQALIDGIPVLQHLADALDDPSDVDVATLIEKEKKYRYTSAPDPSAWIDETFEAHQDLPPLAPGAVPLRVLTYNTGLLSRKYLGTEVEVPHITKRRDRFAEELFTAGYDILLLQEVWEWEDVQRLADAAPDHGYVVYGGTEELHPEHGLAIAVREAIIDPAFDQDHSEQQFFAQRKLEYNPGPKVRRGWITWSFRVAGTDTTLHLYDLHATSYVQFWQKRDLQAREVGLEVSARPDTDVVLLGGDLNSGPYYDDDIWVDGEGKKVKEWWRNASAWALWQYYGEMYDVHGAAAPLEDVELGRTVPMDSDGYLDEPYGDESWCDTTPVTTFTGTDCNSLYFEQYAGTEFPARLDHLMARDPEAHLRVDDSWLEFVDPLEFSDGTYELSDHYGLGAALRLGTSE